MNKKNSKKSNRIDNRMKNRIKMIRTSIGKRKYHTFMN